MEKLIKLSDRSAEAIKIIMEYYKESPSYHDIAWVDWTESDIVALAISDKLDAINARKENELYLARLKERMSHHE